MIEIKLEKGSLKLYNSITQLPAVRYKDFQKYQLLDGGIGSTMEDVNERYSNLFAHLKQRSFDDIKRELENLYYNHYFIINNISPKHMSFACLIHSVNDEIVDDSSEENLKKVIEQCSELGLTQEILEAQLLEAKKKIRAELKTNFPKMFPEETSLTYYQNVKKKIMAMLAEAENAEQDLANQSIIDETSRALHAFLKPVNLKMGDPESELLKIERNYNQLCASLESNGGVAKDLTVMEMYGRVDYYRELNKKLKDKNRGNE